MIVHKHNKVNVQFFFKEKPIGIHIIAKIPKIMLLKYFHAWLKVVILSPLSNKAFIFPTSSKIKKKNKKKHPVI